MASSVVDRKFLGKCAKEVEPDNPLLSSTLYKILGLSDRLSELLVTARKQRRWAPEIAAESHYLHQRILWLAREGLVMLEQYVLPMVTNANQLKVLAYKLRASLYHIVVLFHNQPSVHAPAQPARESQSLTPGKVDKGKGIAREDNDDGDDDDVWPERVSSRRGDADDDGGGESVAPPPGIKTEASAAFLLPVGDYLPQALRCFRDAADLADHTLWGSHSLRLSVKTEFAAFLFECVHDEEASRRLARRTINEVYEATEGIDNDMFQDACELVTVLGKMMKRGLALSSSAASRSKRSSSPLTTVRSALPSQQQQGEVVAAPTRTTKTAPAGPPGPAFVPAPEPLLYLPQPPPAPAPRLFAAAAIPPPQRTTAPAQLGAQPSPLAAATLPPTSQSQPGFI